MRALPESVRARLAADETLLDAHDGGFVLEDGYMRTTNQAGLGVRRL